MSLSTTLRVVLRRWYITVPGVLLSLTMASMAFSLVPPKYTSSGIAVLVEQKNPATATNFINPVLRGDGSLNTATLTLVQALDTPAVKAELGLRKGVDNFTIKNVGSAAIADGADHPFLYITTQSSNPQESVDIVADVMSMAREKLINLQTALHVAPQNQIKLESVVDATAPKAVMGTSFAAMGAALMLGIITTCIVACAWDGIIVARQKRQIHQSTSRAKENTDPQVKAIPLRLN
jgi:capsular polysaccharide biosynthesis protein